MHLTSIVLTLFLSKSLGFDTTIKVTEIPESCPIYLQVWVGDSFCDDDSNTLACGYDGGDCCGSESNFDYCLLCECHEIDYYDYKECEDCITFIQWYEASGKYYNYGQKLFTITDIW